MKIRNGFVSNSSSSSFTLKFNHVPMSLHDLAEKINLIGSPIGTLETIHNKIQKYIRQNDNDISNVYISRICEEILYDDYNSFFDYFDNNDINTGELIHKSLFQIVKENDNNIPVNEEIKEVTISFSGKGSYETVQEDFVYRNGVEVFGEYLINTEHA